MNPTTRTYEDIDPYELMRRVDELDAPVIDVREAWEYQMGHVPGAIHVPMHQIPDRLDDIQDGTVFVCASGNRSGQVCAWLAANGKKDLANLAGGTQGWMMHGLDVE